VVKRVLVTGASGFIGRHCLPLLVERGFEVHALALGSPPAATDVFWHTADLLDEVRTRSALHAVRPTHLLHLAWVTEPGTYQHSEENFRWVGASLSLLEHFRGCEGTRVVVAGSCAEYDPRSDLRSEDSTPLTPATPYGVCKHSLQLMLDAFARAASVSAAWGRVFYLYGPHEHPRRLIPSVAQALLAGEEARCTAGE
jgi:nucleoside-diphosphate-sugar epimerase